MIKVYAVNKVSSLSAEDWIFRSPLRTDDVAVVSATCEKVELILVKTWS
jgi:hypothetical protein